MTSNTVILTQPDNESVLNHEIPNDSSARLNYDVADIEGLAIGPQGELIISFEDGGQVNITNFDSFTEGGNLLYLSDGTLVDATILTSAPLNPVALNNVETAAGDASTQTISKPDANTTQEMNIEEGVNYVCDFDPKNAALVETKDGQMILTFADGSQVVINNYDQVVAGQLPEELTVADAAVVEENVLTEVTDVDDIVEGETEGEETVALVKPKAEPESDSVAQRLNEIEAAAGEDALAAQLNQIETAAGENGAVASGGNRFNSEAVDITFEAPDAIGPLGPTALRYNAPQFDQELFLEEQTAPNGRPGMRPDALTLDETNLASGPLVASGDVNVNFGSDGVGSLGPNGNFAATCDVAGVELTSGGVKVEVTPTADGYIGTAGGNTVFTFVLDVETGEYTYTQVAPFDHGDTANDNEPICLDFGIVATDRDGDAVNVNVQVNVLDDAPIVLSQVDQTVDETNADAAGNITVNGQFFADAGQDVGATFGGTDSVTSSVPLTSNGVPVQVGYNDATNTYIGTAGTAVIFTVEIDPATGEYEFIMSGPLDHPDATNPDDSIAINFGAFITDFDGDTKEGSFTVNVKDDGPTIQGDQNVVDETDGNVIVTGNAVLDGGYDGVQSFGATGDFASGGSRLNNALTSNGVPVDVAYDDATGTYTGTAGTETIFTMQINDDGSYTFELVGTLDHADTTNPNDIINLDFPIQIVDGDGDTANDIIRILVKDDVPTIGDSSGDVDETNFDLGPLVYQDVLDTSFGADLSEISANGASAPSTPLFSNGQPVTINQNGNSYVGTTPNGDVIFTLAIDPDTAEYVYTQNAPLDHPDSDDADDIISIDFGVQIVSNDGSQDEGTITINIADDGPVANDDINGAEEGQTITGSVVPNDELSEDVANTVTNVNFEGTNFVIPANGSQTITGNYGELTINSDGTYTYVANENDPDGVDSFTYTLTDRDGDTDTAKLDITVTPDGEPVAVDESLAVDETNLTPGPMIFNGDLDVDFGADGGGQVVPQDNVVAGGSLLGGTLTSNNVPVVTTLEGNTYTGKAGDEVIFTLEVREDGTYTFQLFSHLDHADATDPNDAITLDFAVLAVDADGDEAMGNINILVYDDAPVAYDDGTTTLDESATVSGNVTDNDELGEDKPNNVVEVIFNGVTTAVPVGGAPVTINGTYGVLTLSSDGSYSYKANDNNPEGTDTFEYVLEDFDGDQDTAEISFEVNPLNDTPVIIKPAVEIVDETNLDAGNLTDTGTIEANFFNDGPGTIKGNDSFTSSVALTSGGIAVLVTYDADAGVYTGTAGTEEIFTLAIQENGDYVYTQTGVLDHPDSTDPNDSIDLNFGVVATDKDGDTAETSVTVRVLDDGPVAADDVFTVDESNVATGNVTNNDEYGEDGAGRVLNVEFEGTTYPVSEVGVTTIDGNYGKLEIQSNGDYTYTANDDIDGTTTVTSTNTFKPESTDVDGIQNSISQNGITITSNNGEDLTFVAITNLGSGVGIAGNRSDKVITRDTVETLELRFDEPADEATFTLADIGDNNVGKDFTYNVYLADGSVVTETITLDAALVTNGLFTQDVSGYGSEITRIDLVGGPKGAGPSFLLAEIEVRQVEIETVKDEFTYTIEDFDGDTSQAEICILVQPTNETPIIIKPEVEGVDETNLDAGNLTLDGTIIADFKGEDGTIDPDGKFTASNGDLTSCDKPVEVTVEGNSYIGTREDGVIVFRVDIEDNGEYVFTQFEAIDHPDATDPNDFVTLNFGVTATDENGDTASTTLSVNVYDDGPQISEKKRPIDETDADANGELSYTHTLNFDFGEDGAGAITTTDTFQTKYQVGGSDQQLKAGGEDVTVTSTDNSYTGTTASGAIVFTLVIDPTSGQYTYTQVQPIDHPDDTNPDDVIWLKFGVQITDKDGDTDTAMIVVDLHDDGPRASDDTDSVDEGDTTSGTVITNDEYGFDGAGSVIKVTFGGVEYDVAETGTTTINGTYGVLKIASNGDYTYKANDGVSNETVQDVFGYTIEDFDGDTATATLTINVALENDTPIIVKPANEVVDETNLDAGNLTDTGKIEANFFNDGPGTIKGNDTFTSSVALTSGGVAVVVTYDTTAGVYTGKAGTETIFTLAIQEDGDYLYTQTGVLDHPNTNNPNDAINLNFGVVATDKDGDTASTTLTVKVLDDGPVIHDKAKPIDESDADANGEISYTHKLNFDFGEDGAGSIMTTDTFQAKYQVGGQDQQLKSGGDNVIVTSTNNTYTGALASGAIVFTLSIDPASGEYTYTQFQAIDHPDATDADDVIWLKFGVKITDADGDTGTAMIIVDLHDDGPKAHDDTRITDGDVLVGNVTENDDYGFDGAGCVSKIKFDGKTFVVAEQGTTTINGDYGVLKINSNGDYTYTPNGTAAGTTVAFAITSADVVGIQSSISESGIIISSNNGEDLTWVNTADGSGVGILGNRSDKVISRDSIETLEVRFDESVDSASFTITEIGANNVDKDFTYKVYLENGDVVTETVNLSSGQVTNGAFTQDVSGYGSEITRIDLVGGPQFKGPSFLLSEVSGQTDGEVGSDTFCYVIKDADGDTSQASLVINGTSHNYIQGDDGHNTLYGTDGDDFIYGGAGDDILRGGLGKDTFLFNAINEGLDTIKDFNTVEDTLDLSNVLTGFEAGEDINDFLFAVQENGDTTLFVDANGGGALDDATALVTLENDIVSIDDLVARSSIIV